MATEALLPMQPSLGSATSTRVDSSKLHLQCRVSTDDMISYTETKSDRDDLLRNKYRYCIHKDEIVIAVGRPWNSTLSRKKTNNAYPRVISNMGAMDGTTERGRLMQRVIKYMNHFARTVQEKNAIIRAFSDDNFTFADLSAGNTVQYHEWPRGGNADTNVPAYFSDEDLQQIREDVIPYLFDFCPMGYATTLGWAHPNTGDTMVTVMIGGIRTVMNGDFEIFTGDLIQWYWPFELDCFKKDGRRKRYVNGWYEKQNGGFAYIAPMNLNPTIDLDNQLAVDEAPVMSKDVQSRKRYHEQVYGQKITSPKVVPRIKPFMRDEMDPRLYDGLRVFAVATSSARPHEMVDIKISRQCF